MARIENHKYSIEEAFRECFYIVPDYQREWPKKSGKPFLSTAEPKGEELEVSTPERKYIGCQSYGHTWTPRRTHQFDRDEGLKVVGAGFPSLFGVDPPSIAGRAALLCRALAGSAVQACALRPSIQASRLKL